MSPEIVNGKPYDFGVDFWALGCLIYKLLTNKYPFEAQSMPKLFYKIIKGKYSNYNIPEKYKNIGIRIEDNVVVTETGFKVLTDLVPKEVSDIESLMNS